jgi:hypothetical protein
VRFNVICAIRSGWVVLKDTVRDTDAADRGASSESFSITSPASLLAACQKADRNQRSDPGLFR